jgi:hypothetical protein
LIFDVAGPVHGIQMSFNLHYSLSSMSPQMVISTKHTEEYREFESCFKSLAKVLPAQVRVAR